MIRYGTAYYPDHWPESDWARDLSLIRDSGLSTVRFGEFSWSWFEPRDGVFDFAAYDRFMDTAHRCGLDVILCTPTCNAPHWLFARYPDARQIDQKGRPHIGHRHMTNYNHPGAYELAQRAVTKLAQQYRDHPALFGWQIDNELTAGESGNRDQIYDHHPLTIERFREYLRHKYGTLDELNARWFNNFWSNQYSDWSEVEPQRIGENRNPNPSAWLDWSRFRDLNVARLGQWQADWLHAVNPSFRIGTNIPEVDPLRSVWLGQDYWGLSRNMDFIGTDLYVYCDDPDREQRLLAYSCDVIRSAAHAAGAEFGVLETQAGPHLRPWRMSFAGGMWEPGFLKRSVETYAAHGAEHILFFLWRAVPGGTELGMNSLAHIDGSPSERTAALPDIIAAGEQARSRLNDRPVAYLHYSQDTLRLMSLVDPDQTVNSTMWGWHWLFTDLGYRIEYLSDDTLPTIHDLPPGLLALPYSVVMSPALCQTVIDAARTGWQVIAGPATAYFDDRAHIYLQSPGPTTFSDLLGLRYTGFDANRLLRVDGLPSVDMRVLQTRTRATGDLTALAENDLHFPMLTCHENVIYVGFDAGTLRHALTDAAPLVDWFHQHTGV